MSGNHRKGSDMGVGKSMKKMHTKMPISLSHSAYKVWYNGNGEM